MPMGRAPLVLRRGDVLGVKFYYHPELNDRQTIRPDGKVSLQLVNEVDAAGLVPEEFRVKLLELYTDVVIDPEITVVVETEQRHVFVGGEVNIPAGEFPVRVPLVERLTPLEAIMQSRGFLNASAKLSNVLIIRRIDDKQYARTVDLRTPFHNPESEPFYLEANDIVFVPRTKIDRVNQWVDQYMNRTVPEWLDLNVNYSFAETNTKSRQEGTRSTTTFSPNGVNFSRTR